MYVGKRSGNVQEDRIRHINSCLVCVKEKRPCHENAFCLSVIIYVGSYIYLLHEYMLLIYVSLSFIFIEDV